MSCEAEKVMSMVRSFRLTELQSLMLFAGKKKQGKKMDLQIRALALVEENDEKAIDKIRELSSSMYKSIGGATSVNPYSANYVGGGVNCQPASDATASPWNAAAADLQNETKKVGDGNRKKRKKKKKKKILTRMSAPPPPPHVGGGGGQQRRQSRRSAAIAASAALAAQAGGIGGPYGDFSSSCSSSSSSSSSDSNPSESGESESEEVATDVEETQPKKKQKSGGGGGVPAVTSTVTASTSTTTVAASTSTTAPLFQQQQQSLSSASALAASYAHLMGRGSWASMGGLPVTPPPPPPLNIPNYCGFTYRRGGGGVVGNADPSSRSASYIPPAPKPSHPIYPTFADVKLQKLPFFDVLSTLLKPSSLQPKGGGGGGTGHAPPRFQEQTFSFHLTPQQVNEIEQSGGRHRDAFGRPDYKKQIQLRFSLLETSCEQTDHFPSSVCVKVNGRMQPLPNPVNVHKPGGGGGVEPRRPPKPINVTNLCKLSSTSANHVSVSWTVEVGRGHTLSVYFVEKLSSCDLLHRLKAKGQRHADYTRAVIKDKLNDTDDGEIATTSCKVSLACPLGKMRMRMPCRSSSCGHLQCFDANNYLMMNERKDKWMCPVCNNSASFDTLMLDGYFTEMLASRKLPDDEHEIVLHSDATWDPMPAKIPDHLNPKNFAPPPPPARDNNKKKVETLSLTDEDEEQQPLKKRRVDDNVVVVECVTLDSDDAEQEEVATAAVEEAAAAAAASAHPLSKCRRRGDSPVTSSTTSSVVTLTPPSMLSSTEPPSSPTPPPAHQTRRDDNPMTALAAAARELARMRSLSSADPPLICLDDDD